MDPNKIVVLKSDWDKKVELKPGEIVIQDVPGKEFIPTTELEGLRKRLKELEDEMKRRPDKPLVFPLEEASGYAFALGHAELPPGFGEKLEQDIVPKIRAIVEEYPIEVMEIIGHTDGTPKSGASNLDALLTGFEFGASSAAVIERLEAGSNADLGLARALSVGTFLMNSFTKSDSPRLQALVCRVYSGAHLISPVENIVQGGLNADTPARRRIELRFTRKNRLDAQAPVEKLPEVKPQSFKINELRELYQRFRGFATDSQSPSEKSR
ncbi:MAG: hypothetical protein EOP09_04855 [Proteobacteria bacterium]|nr:MAG: hypothetical protein EOP09_04855 [Pseudomonadota bacterium]